MRLEAERHLELAATHIAVAESGDAKRAAYEKAADEILAARVADSDLSLREVGRRIGKSDHWVRTLLTWAAAPESQTPFARDPENDFRARHEERKIPTEPADRLAMAKTLLEDPKVVEGVLATPSVASRRVENAVHEKNVGREREVERRRRAEHEMAEASAPPLSAHMARMVRQIHEWAGGLAALVDDLDELPAGRGRELVAEAIEDLGREVERWRAKLQRPALEIIDGEAKSA